MVQIFFSCASIKNRKMNSDEIESPVNDVQKEESQLTFLTKDQFCEKVKDMSVSEKVCLARKQHFANVEFERIQRIKKEAQYIMDMAFHAAFDDGAKELHLNDGFPNEEVCKVLIQNGFQIKENKHYLARSTYYLIWLDDEEDIAEESADECADECAEDKVEYEKREDGKEIKVEE